MIINAHNIVFLQGRTAPFVFDGKLVKLENLPDWPVFDEARERRELCGCPVADIKRECVGSDLARILGVYTPEVSMEDVVLENGNAVFHTRAAVRYFLDIESYSSTDRICFAVPDICRRLDWQYITLVDLIIGNWNRTGKNLLYDRAKNTLVAIDYDASLTWDIPVDATGMSKVIDEFLFSPDLSRIFEVNVALFKLVGSYIVRNAQYGLMKAIDNESGRNVTRRSILLSGAIRQFVREYKIGLVKIPRPGITEEACLTLDLI